MSTLFERAAWPACTSALLLDRLALGELPAEDADALRTHLEECDRCSAAAAALARDRTASLPPLRLPVTGKPPTLKLVPAPEEPLRVAAPYPAPKIPTQRMVWARRGAALGAVLAAAGVAFVIARPADEPQERATLRTKGAQVELTMFVQHADLVRRALPGEVVAAGDAVRFALTSPAGGFAAVLSLDPRGKAFVYYPLAAKAVELQAGHEVALPLGTRLDDSVGTERLLGLVCSSPVDLEPVRSALEAKEGAALPPGCEGSQWSFVKR